MNQSQNLLYTMQARSQMHIQRVQRRLSNEKLVQRCLSNESLDYLSNDWTSSPMRRLSNESTDICSFVAPHPMTMHLQCTTNNYDYCTYIHTDSSYIPYASQRFCQQSMVTAYQFSHQKSPEILSTVDGNCLPVFPPKVTRDFVNGRW